MKTKRQRKKERNRKQEKKDDDKADRFDTSGTMATASAEDPGRRTIGDSFVLSTTYSG